MNNKFRLPLTALALSLGMIPAMAAAEDDAPPPPPPHEMRQPGPGGDIQSPGGRRMRPRMGDGRVMPAAMNEEEQARFRELNQAVQDALEAYRANPGDETLAALKTKLTAMVEARQAFEIDRAEKALARAKAQAGKKDEIVNRQLKHMTAPQRRRGPGEGKAPERRDRRGNMPQFFTEAEMTRLKTAREALAKAEAKSDAETKAVEAMKKVHQDAVTRIQAEIARLKAEGKDTASLERSVKFLNRAVEQMADPAKYAERMKNRPPRGERK